MQPVKKALLLLHGLDGAEIADARRQRIEHCADDVDNVLPERHIVCKHAAVRNVHHGGNNRSVDAVVEHAADIVGKHPGNVAEYAAALETADCTVRRHFLREDEDFAVTEAFVSAVDEDADMVFLCQPNNPTGQLTPLPLVEALLHRCEACGALLVVDECFLDFLPESEALSAKKLLASPNLIILKAFTKLYGMAGVRLGYCLCSNIALLDKMQAAGQPWAVSSLAQAAGLAALDETAYVARVQELIAQQRPILRDGLRALGLRVLDGSANYLLFQASETLGDSLRQRGIVLRSCGNYPGLDGSWYRTAVRTAPENEQLLQTMREVLK